MSIAIPNSYTSSLVRPPARMDVMPLELVMVIRRMRGGSQSRLVECDDGKLYILKTHPSPQGPNVLANDALGTTIMHGLGFSVPKWRPIRINLKALRHFPELLMEAEGERVLPSCGDHFGSEFLGGPGYTTFDFIPGSAWDKVRNLEEFLSVSLFDIWAGHRDDRQCVFWKKSTDTRYRAMFLDNGHLFGGPSWQQLSAYRGLNSMGMNTSSLNTSHIEGTLALFDRRVPQLLKDAIPTIPRGWYQGDINSLHVHLLLRLKNLRRLLADGLDKYRTRNGFRRIGQQSLVRIPKCN